MKTIETWTPDRTAQLNAELAALEPQDRIARAAEVFGDGLVMSTSFGVQSAVLLHMATRVVPGIPVVFVDTGYLFKETYLFAAQLEQRLNLNLKKTQPAMSAAEHEALYGKQWEQGREGLEKYNFIRKVEPMNRALSRLGATAWLTGLRRVQSESRQNLDVALLQRKIVKIHPILEWSERDVYKYLQKHNLPYHPLWDEGYVSVGDTHSTKKYEEGMDPSDTRFNGIKRECGLHEVSDRGDFQI